MNIGGFFSLAGGEFTTPRKLRPKIISSGLRACIDDEMIPAAKRIGLGPDDFTVFWGYAGLGPGDLELDDMERAINSATPGVSFEELEFGCQDYYEAIGHKPLLYMGSLRVWLLRRSTKPMWEPIQDATKLVASRRHQYMSGFVWDEGAVYKMGSAESSILAALVAEFEGYHFGEPRPVYGSIASVSTVLPTFCLASKWKDSGGSFGDTDHVPLSSLKARGCGVTIIDAGGAPQWYADQLKLGVGVALGHSTITTKRQLLDLATAGTGGGGGGVAQ